MAVICQSSGTSNVDKQQIRNRTSININVDYLECDLHRAKLDYLTRFCRCSITEDNFIKLAMRYSGVDKTDLQRRCPDQLCREVLLSDCIPCCHRRRGVPGACFIWSFIRGDAFLYSIHIISIILGSTKAVLDLRNTYPDLLIGQSVIETAATLLLICVRIGNSVEGYTEVKTAVRKLADITRGTLVVVQDNIHARQIKFWMCAMIGCGGLLSVGCIVFFHAFYVTDHLDWTLLSNNFCMITITTLANLYRARIQLTVVEIRESQHNMRLLDVVRWDRGVVRFGVRDEKMQEETHGYV